MYDRSVKELIDEYLDFHNKFFKKLITSKKVSLRQSCAHTLIKVRTLTTKVLGNMPYDPNTNLINPLGYIL